MSNKSDLKRSGLVRSGAGRQNQLLKAGDPVMVIAGGNKSARPLIGKVAKLLKIVGSSRAVVEGLNMNTRHKKARGMNETAGKVSQEGALHLSNLMYYVERIKAPVRLKKQVLADGKKVRGFINPETKKFEQI